MGRPERRIDPAADPVQALAQDLRQLRRSAGVSTYEELASRTQATSTPRQAKALSAAAAGHRCPSWNTLEAYVLACGGRPREWQGRYDRARAWRPTATPPDASERTEDATDAAHPSLEHASEPADDLLEQVAVEGAYPDQRRGGPFRLDARLVRWVVGGVLAALLISATLYGAVVGFPRTVRGTVTCVDGEDVVGIWVKAGTDESGFARWVRAGSPSTASFERDLPRRLDWTVSVGCGGTTRDWTYELRSADFTSSRQQDWQCMSVRGPDYGCRPV